MLVSAALRRSGWSCAALFVCFLRCVRTIFRVTRMLDGLCVCARPYLIRVYVHPTPVAAEIILRHTAYFFFFLELIGAWQSSRDKEREDAHSRFLPNRLNAQQGQEACERGTDASWTTCEKRDRDRITHACYRVRSAERGLSSPRGMSIWAPVRSAQGHAEFKSLSSGTGNRKQEVEGGGCFLSLALYHPSSAQHTEIQSYTRSAKNTRWFSV